MGRYFDDFNTNDEILHYGVKGMKWRKRLARRLTKSALEDNRKTKTLNQLNKIDQNAADNSRKKANALRNGRVYGAEKYFLTGSQKETVAKYEDKDANRRQEKIKKRKRKQTLYRMSEKAKTKLAKIIGGK